MICPWICNECGGEVAFVYRKPVNQDGTPHWDVCKARQFARVKKNGIPYRTEDEAGYIYKGERWPTWKRGPTIVGNKYRTDGCGCGLPPWELCGEKCQYAVAA